jgi:cell division protein FtsI (penicillin-binding protein 3)
MASPATRIGFLQFVFFAGLVAVVGRAVQLQVVEGARWKQVADSTRTRTVLLPPRRGTIYDRSGSPLAISQEFYRVGVAPWEVRVQDRGAVAALLVRDLDMPPARVRAAFRDPRQGERYLYRYQLATASEIERLRRYHGVSTERVYRRAYPNGKLAAAVIGNVAESRRGRTGLEAALDELLTGTPGKAVYLRDRSGTLYESPDRLVRDPVPGSDVLLTLDTELQGIAEAGLAETLEEQKADAGDVVLLDPRSGEILALATVVRRPEGARRAGPWVPAEPGSTIKPFAAAGLLRLGRAKAQDSVYGENGEWRLSGRSRPIKDTHPHPGYLTLAKAIEISSNVGMAKFTLKLRPEEHYDLLRDFGFGAPTGIEVPYESPGLLKRPDRWQPMNTQPSMAQGYEVEVTPLQLAAGYAAIANGGLLPSLTLIREVRDPQGVVRYHHEPAPVRRVISPEVAAEVRSFLLAAASSEGTGSRAQLDRYQVIGKTGTTRNVVGGVYTSSYTSSFAGIFPAKDPQLVVVIRIVNPSAGEYYGGLVAAPLTRTMLQNALSARKSALDRRRFAERPAVAEDTRPRPVELDEPAAGTVLITVPLRRATSPEPSIVAVPDVLGATVRQAALMLHRRGLRVLLKGVGTVASMSPQPGDSVKAGSLVSLVAEPGG